MAASGLITKLTKAGVLLTKPVWRAGLMHGVAATIEHRPLAELITPRTVIDIGANKGQFTLFALQMWPGCRVLAFEPLPGPAAKFRRAVGNRDNVKLFMTAIGPQAGSTEIHLSEREDSSSLLEIGERMEQVFPEARAAGKSVTIQVGPLESYVHRHDVVGPTLLKLDVQGYELEALKGCADLLPLIDYAYVECSFVELYKGQALYGDICEHMSANGFSVGCEINSSVRPGVGRVQTDVLFRRSSPPRAVPLT